MSACVWLCGSNWKSCKRNWDAQTLNHMIGTIVCHEWRITSVLHCSLPAARWIGSRAVGWLLLLHDRLLAPALCPASFVGQAACCELPQCWITFLLKARTPTMPQPLLLIYVPLIDTVFCQTLLLNFSSLCRALQAPLKPSFSPTAGQ